MNTTQSTTHHHQHKPTSTTTTHNSDLKKKKKNPPPPGLGRWRHGGQWLRSGEEFEEERNKKNEGGEEKS